MNRSTAVHLRYPVNLHELDLATMVHMYRSRGEPKKAQPGSYLACAYSQRLIKEAKWWFGLYYSQESWDALLTHGSNGFPLTDTELVIFGMIYEVTDKSLSVHRGEVEKSCGAHPKLAYLIINDLNRFGFIIENRSGYLAITDNGIKALHGISRRIYGKRFTNNLIKKVIPEGFDVAASDETAASRDQIQTSLF